MKQSHLLSILIVFTLYRTILPSNEHTLHEIVRFHASSQPFLNSGIIVRPISSFNVHNPFHYDQEQLLSPSVSIPSRGNVSLDKDTQRTLKQWSTYQFEEYFSDVKSPIDLLGKHNLYQFSSLKIIKEGAKKFEKVEGFEKVIHKILQAKKKKAGEYNMRNIVGAIAEIEDALWIEKQGEKVLAFGKNATFKTTGYKDFDIITKTRAIECKNRLWTRARALKELDILGNRKIIAEKTLGKSFEIHSKTSLPEEIKKWCKKKISALR